MIRPHRPERVRGTTARVTDLSNHITRGANSRDARSTSIAEKSSAEDPTTEGQGGHANENGRRQYAESANDVLEQAQFHVEGRWHLLEQSGAPAPFAEPKYDGGRTESYGRRPHLGEEQQSAQ